MTTVEKFNPANAANLTEADIKEMRALSNEDIKALATAYPNAAQGNNYLILGNNNLPANRQLYPESTWQNLWNLRKDSASKKATAAFYAFSFKAGFVGRKAARTTVVAAPVAKVQDLTKTDLAKQPGVKEVVKETVKEAAKETVKKGAKEKTSKKKTVASAKAVDYSTMSVKDLAAAYETKFQRKPGKSMNKETLIGFLQGE